MAEIAAGGASVPLPEYDSHGVRTVTNGGYQVIAGSYFLSAAVSYDLIPALSCF